VKPPPEDQAERQAEGRDAEPIRRPGSRTRCTPTLTDEPAATGTMADRGDAFLPAGGSRLEAGRLL